MLSPYERVDGFIDALTPEEGGSITITLYALRHTILLMLLEHEAQVHYSRNDSRADLDKYQATFQVTRGH